MKSRPIIWLLLFDSVPSWQLFGGYVGATCGTIYSGTSAVFDGPGKSREICTPLIDPRKAGNVRFNFALGMSTVRLLF